MHPIESSDEFKKLVVDCDHGKLILVDFHAQWCGPCKMMAPKLEEMSKEHEDVMFYKVDVDEVDDVASSYSISAMPTFLFFKNGKKLGEVIGARVEDLKDALLNYKKS